MFSSFIPAALVFANSLASQEGVAPDGSEPIGWLAGGFTLVFFIVVGLLLWSFIRTQRRAKALWEEKDESLTEKDSPADQ